MRASFVHLATDAAGSLGAVVAGLLILGWGWLRADSVVSMATAVLVLWAGWGLLSDTTHVLMEGTPRGMDAERVRAAMLEVGGVAEFHHLHLFLWNLRRHPDGVRRSRLTPRRVGRRVAAGSSPPHEPPACARRRDAAPLADLGRVLALVAFAVLSWTPALRQMPPAPHRPTTPRGWCRRGRRRR